MWSACGTLPRNAGWAAGKARTGRSDVPRFLRMAAGDFAATTTRRSGYGGCREPPVGRPDACEPPCDHGVVSSRISHKCRQAAPVAAAQRPAPDVTSCAACPITPCPPWSRDGQRRRLAGQSRSADVWWRPTHDTGDLRWVVGAGSLLISQAPPPAEPPPPPEPARAAGRLWASIRRR